MTLHPDARGAGLAAIVLSTALIGGAYASAFLPGGARPWSVWGFVLGIPCMMVGLMALGAGRRGRGTGRLLLPFAFVWLVLGLGFGLALLLPSADTPEMTLWLGLPPRAAMVLYGIGFAPVLVLPLAYALSFGEITLSKADLERVRAVARAREQNAPIGLSRASEAGATADPS